MGRIGPVIVAAVVFGCGGGNAPSTPLPAGSPDAGSRDQDAGEIEAGPPVGVSGTWITTYLNSRGQAQKPTDLSARALGVWTVAGDGTFVHHPGRGAADGTFQVPDGPPGPFTFYIETASARPLYIHSTDDRTIHLGGLTSGRPEIESSNDAATNLTLSVSGLKPWTAADALEVEFDDLIHFLRTGPAVGETAHSFMLSGRLPLIDGPGGGDSVVVSQVVTSTLAEGVVQRTIATGRLIDTFTLRAFEANLLDVPMTAPPEQAVNVNFRQSAFAALAGEVFPGSQVSAGLVRLNQVQEPAIIAPPSTTLALGFEDGSTDQTVITSYRSLRPETWATVGSASVAFQVSYPIAGSAAPAVLTESISVRDVASKLLAGPILPIVSPPREPTINGLPAREVLQGVGETPVVAWQAPTRGQPTHYQITVRELVPELDRVRVVLAATLYTAEVQLRIPKGLLQPGKQYVLAILARQREGSRAVQPFVGGPRYATATTLTGRISP